MVCSGMARNSAPIDSLAREGNTIRELDRSEEMDFLESLEFEEPDFSDFTDISELRDYNDSETDQWL